MRNVIISLIDKLIISKYDSISYGVIHTNDLYKFNNKTGYSVTYTNFPPDSEEEIIKLTEMILKSLGLSKVHKSYHGLTLTTVFDNSVIQIVGED